MMNKEIRFMESVQNKFQQRYPDIHFFLSFFPHQKKEPVYKQDIHKHFLAWKETVPLDQIDVLYCIGLECSEVFLQCQDWLSAKKERTLIFIENDLGFFPPFLTKVFAEPIVDHPQVHIHYSEEDPIEVLAQKFPTDRLTVFIPPDRTFDAVALMRRSAAFSALYSDVLYSHHLFKNVRKNFFHLRSAFDANQWKGTFANIPAIICGAGPSLQKSFAILNQLQTRALIIAGGSAVPILSKQGIRPHLAMALDPNEEEYQRFEQSTYFEGPFLFAPRLHHQVFATCNGPFGYLRTNTGGLAESWLEDRLGLTQEAVGPDLGDEAFSVTTLAVSTVYALGCNPIIFVGVDLAFSGGKQYASGIEVTAKAQTHVPNLDRSLISRDIFGNPIETLLKWVMESDAISRFALTHQDCRFFNATEGGIGFKEIENITLAKAVNTYCKTTRDLEGYIHRLIQEFPCAFSSDSLLSHYKDLQKSLTNSLNICQQIIEEFTLKKESAFHSGKVILLQNDFVEQHAYQCFLKGIDLALQHLLVRYFPHVDPHAASLEREIAKWQELHRQIHCFLQAFS